MSHRKQWKIGNNVSEKPAGYNFTTLMMEVAGSSKTPLPIHQTTQSTKTIIFNWITFLNTISHIQSNIGTYL